jgi:hypothetical protein
VRTTTRQLTKCEWNSGLPSKNTNTLASLACFFPPLTYPFYILGQFFLFFYLASENTELLASLASVLKNLFTPLGTINNKKNNDLETGTWNVFVVRPHKIQHLVAFNHRQGCG